MTPGEVRLLLDSPKRDEYLRSKLPPAEERITASVGAPVRIARDRWSIPHIWAGSERDALVGLGYCMGRDRLWQLDYLRREATGTLAELLGPSAHANDLRMRTIGIAEIATEQAERLDGRTRELLDGFVAGVERARQVALDNLPVEFDLLGYEPAPWTLVDTLALMRGLWWQLTGRLENLVAAEAAARYLSEADFALFMTPELPDERILPADEPWPAAGLLPAPLTAPLGVAGEVRAGGVDASGCGSNNWAVAGSRTTTGKALLAADPHLPLVHPSDFYEAHLSWPGHDVVGAHWAGAPGASWGYNGRIAWGLTNNACSTRDIYVETINPTNPNEYRRDDRWLPFRTRTIEIVVRGEAPRRHVVRSTDLGPLINEVTPSVEAGGDPPLSLRWVGQEALTEFRSLFAVQHATSWDGFRAALADWSMPSWNWVYADALGEVGWQHAGRIPVRGRVVRGYRDANNPDDRWQGYVPYEGMPRIHRPKRGYVATANNRGVPDDYPYPFYGAFAGGNRAVRIRQRLEQVERMSPSCSRDLQNDVYLTRAARLAPLLKLPELEGWDFGYRLESRAPTFFETVLHLVAEALARRHFPEHLVGLTHGNALAAVGRLLERGELGEEVGRAAREARAGLKAWGELHTMTFKHPLGFDVGPAPVPGSGDSVRNAAGAFERGFEVVSGAEYRFLVDFAAATPASATNTLGQSGQPGSPFYDDQLGDWVDGRYHPLLTDRNEVERQATAISELRPLAD